MGTPRNERVRLGMRVSRRLFSREWLARGALQARGVDKPAPVVAVEVRSVPVQWSTRLVWVAMVSISSVAVLAVRLRSVTRLNWISRSDDSWA
jgi:hypothetical protein